MNRKPTQHAEFDRLLERAKEWEPPMPPADEQGLYPARETMAVIQARDIIRRVEPGGAGAAEWDSGRDVEPDREGEEQAERGHD